MNRVDFLEKVVALMIRHYGTKAAASEVLGVTQSYLNMILAGTKPVTDKMIVSVRSATGYDFYKPETLDGPPRHYQTSTARPVSDAHVLEVPLVPSFASAGYVRGYADQEFIDTLPTVSFFVEQKVKGNYVAFEVIGESMFDGSFDSYIEGDRVLCREVPRHHWRDKLHFKKWDFVIAHRDEGILIKKITAHDTGAGTITAHSLHPDYPDQVLSLDDVAQLFNVVRVERRK